MGRCGMSVNDRALKSHPLQLTNRDLMLSCDFRDAVSFPGHALEQACNCVISVEAVSTAMVPSQCCQASCLESAPPSSQSSCPRSQNGPPASLHPG